VDARAKRGHDGEIGSFNTIGTGSNREDRYEHSSRDAGKLVGLSAVCGRRVCRRDAQSVIGGCRKAWRSRGRALSAQRRRQARCRWARGHGRVDRRRLPQRPGDGRSSPRRRRGRQSRQRIRRHATLCSRGERGSGNDREVLGSRRRCQRGTAVGRNAAHGGGPSRQSGDGACIAVGGCQSQRAGSKRRTNRPDVGGRGTSRRGYRGTGARRRRRPTRFENRVHRVDVCRPAGRRQRYSYSDRRRRETEPRRNRS
jgi:hypothetical protein